MNTTRVQGNRADTREHLSLGKHSSCSKILPILNNFSLFSSPWKDEELTLQLSLERLQLSSSWSSFLLRILQERSLSDTITCGFVSRLNGSTQIRGSFIPHHRGKCCTNKFPNSM